MSQESVAELQAKLEKLRETLAGALKISTTAVEKHLQRLKALGYIERVGPAKGGHWKVTRKPL